MTVFIASSVPPGKCLDSSFNYITKTSFHNLSSSLFTTIQSFCTIWSALMTPWIQNPHTNKYNTSYLRLLNHGSQANLYQQNSTKYKIIKKVEVK